MHFYKHICTCHKTITSVFYCAKTYVRVNVFLSKSIFKGLLKTNKESAKKNVILHSKVVEIFFIFLKNKTAFSLLIIKEFNHRLNSLISLILNS